ncbi:MAG: hypothetical protein ACQESE_02255 [Nanobdellota archaeon]
MKLDKQTGFVIAAIALVVVVAVIIAFSSTTSIEDKKINKELEAKLDETPEQATEEKPYTAILNPVLVSGEAKVLGRSFFNTGFDQCESEGARVTLDCDDLSIEKSYLSAPKKVSVGSEEVLAAQFNITGDPGLYRCSFSIVCGDFTAVQSITAVRLRAQS